MTTNEAEKIVREFIEWASIYTKVNPQLPLVDSEMPGVKHINLKPAAEIHTLSEAVCVLLKDRKELQDALIPWAGLAQENVSPSVWEDVLKARAALTNRSIT